MDTDGSATGGTSASLNKWLFAAAGAQAVVTLTAIVFYAGQFGWSAAPSIIGVCIISASAASAAGAFSGFLFGIPRVLQSDHLASQESSRVLSNSNLEQISDWLTKILVGVGLAMSMSREILPRG